MLHLIAWASIYSVLLLLVGSATHPWRDRTWFKGFFLPATLCAILLQSAASLLCLASPGKASLFRDRQPAFEVPEPVGCLSGGFFLLVTHGLLYALYLTVLLRLDPSSALNADAVSLPDLHPYEILEGRIQLDASAFLEDVCYWLYSWRDEPLGATLLLYFSAGLFGSLGVSWKSWSRGVAVLAALGALVYVAHWFDVGLLFFGRGWWASIFYFSRWWSLFSLFVLLAFSAAAFFVAARLFVAVMRFLRWSAPRLASTRGPSSSRGDSRRPWAGERGGHRSGYRRKRNRKHKHGRSRRKTRRAPVRTA